MAVPKAAAYCLCGASLTLRGVLPHVAEDILDLFWRSHDGPGHGPTTPAGARRARRAGEGQECKA